MSYFESIYLYTGYLNSAVDFWKNAVSSVLHSAPSAVNNDNITAIKAKETAELALSKMQQLIKTGHPFVRLAGIAGATAVIFGAYGAHALNKREFPEDMRQVYETANKYHFLHSLALLAVPLCRKPFLTGTLLFVGTAIFSGTCYYYALTQTQWVRKITPYGGTMLILGWLSMAL